MIIKLQKNNQKNLVVKLQIDYKTQIELDLPVGNSTFALISVKNAIFDSLPCEGFYTVAGGSSWMYAELLNAPSNEQTLNHVYAISSWMQTHIVEAELYCILWNVV